MNTHHHLDHNDDDDTYMYVYMYATVNAILFKDATLCINEIMITFAVEKRRGTINVEQELLFITSFVPNDISNATVKISIIY